MPNPTYVLKVGREVKHADNSPKNLLIHTIITMTNHFKIWLGGRDLCQIITLQWQTQGIWGLA